MGLEHSVASAHVCPVSMSVKVLLVRVGACFPVFTHPGSIVMTMKSGLAVFCLYVYTTAVGQAIELKIERSTD